MTNPLYNEFFAIAIAITQRCLNGGNPLYDDWFPASGTDFLLKDGFETADRWVTKWLPAVFRELENGRPMGDLRWTMRYFPH